MTSCPEEISNIDLYRDGWKGQDQNGWIFSHGRRQRKKQNLGRQRCSKWGCLLCMARQNLIIPHSVSAWDWTHSSPAVEVWCRVCSSLPWQMTELSWPQPGIPGDWQQGLIQDVTRVFATGTTSMGREWFSLHPSHGREILSRYFLGKSTL